MLDSHRGPNKRKDFKTVAREKVQLVIKMGISRKRGLDAETGNSGIWETLILGDLCT